MEREQTVEGTLNTRLRLLLVGTLVVAVLVGAWFMLRPAPRKAGNGQCTFGELRYSRNAIAKDPSSGKTVQCIAGAWVPVGKG